MEAVSDLLQILAHFRGFGRPYFHSAASAQTDKSKTTQKNL